MSGLQHHIIQRQILDFELLGDESAGRGWQERIGRYAREELPGQLERAFDRCVAPDEVLRLDRLEIEVELTSLDNWESRIAEAIVRQLAAALPPPPDQLPERVSREETLMGQFLYFLATGHLPWSVAEPIRLQFYHEVAAALGGRIAAAQHEALCSLLRDAVVRERLVTQFSEKFLLALIVAFFPKKAAEVLENQKNIVAFAHQARLGRTVLQRSFWTVVLEWAAGMIPLERAPVATRPGTSPALVGTAVLQIAAERLLKQAGSRERKIWNRPPDAAAPPGGAQRAASAPPEPPDPADKPVFGEAAAPPVLPDLRRDLPAVTKPLRYPRLQETEGETIYVDNAGLVLLHPFLTAFFAALKIASGPRLLRPERALHLLQFLATGQATAPEFLLPLNKLLCGWPLQEPVEAQIRLTKKEKQEARHLLEAVIQHWTALKNTTPEGLQGTFLCRGGQLSRREQGWLLRVERTGFDILLENLPWGISIVQLPWMEEMLWVEWG